MTAQSIVCGTCAAEVPYGRLSCPSCGELLASVVGGRRGAAAVGTRVALPDVLYDPASAPTSAVVEGQLSLGSVSLEAVRTDPDEELPWTASTPHAADAASARRAPDAATHDEGGGVAGLVEGLDEADDQPHGHETDIASTGEASSNGRPAWDVGVGMGLGGSPTPAYMPRPRLGRPLPPAPSFAGPGAYLPPLPMTTLPAGPPAPARAWIGHMSDVADRGDSAPATTGAVGEAGAAPATTGAVGEAGSPTSEQVDGRAYLGEFVGWLSVAGAAFSAVGFLLPWGLVVIGSNETGYFARWGLAGPWHLAVAAGVLAVLVLSLVRNAIPAWIRTGLAGLALGALILGLVWPYLLWPPMGAGPGALIAAIGAAALAVSGILALVADRHAEGRRPV